MASSSSTLNGERRHSTICKLLLFDVPFILLHLSIVSEATLSLTSDFDRQFLASPGTSRFFTCTPVATHSDDNVFLKEMRWTWNSKPLLIYDYIKNDNWYPNTFPPGVNVNKQMSGIGRIGLQNLSHTTNGLLTCELVNVFGTSLVRSTHIRVLGTTVSPSITRVQEDSTVTSIVSSASADSIQDSEFDKNDIQQQEDHQIDYNEQIERSQESRATISSDGHPSQADPRILKAQSSSSSLLSSLFHMTLISCVSLTLQIFGYRFLPFT